MVADVHGHEAASKFQEGGGGELVDIMASSEKSKMLIAAIQSTKQGAPFLMLGSPFMAVPQPPRPGAGAIPQSPSCRASQQPLPQQFPPPPGFPGLCATAAAALTTSSDSAPQTSLPPLLENKPAVVTPIQSDEERDVDSYLMDADGGWDVREVGVQDVQVGSLAKCMQFWRMMGASRFIQTIVLHGYAQPFIEVLRAREFANHPSACENAEFVCDLVESLLNQG